MLRWNTAIAIAILINTLSIALGLWYQKGVDGIWCSDQSGEGFIGVAPACPSPRPFTDIAFWFIPLFGVIASGLIPIRALRFVGKQTAAWLILSVAVSAFVWVVAIALIVLIVVAA
jgi:hypothetical protein